MLLNLLFAEEPGKN